MNYKELIEFLADLKAHRFLKISPYENALISQAEIELAATLTGQPTEALSFGVSALFPYIVAGLKQEVVDLPL